MKTYEKTLILRPFMPLLSRLFGVFMQAANQMVLNKGTITTQGDDAFGIVNTGANAVITNSGTISTLGESAFGIVNTGFSSTSKRASITARAPASLPRAASASLFKLIVQADNTMRSVE